MTCLGKGRSQRESVAESSDMRLIKRLLLHFADNSRPGSLATRLRRRRFALFQTLLREAPPTPRVLDVGGTVRFWETMGYGDSNPIELVLLNLKPASHPLWSTLVGDARDLSQFKDGEFDVVFSNSVIEHVGGFRDQTRMADEVRRVGRRYFVQTPNRYFPIEPHFLFPFFQFLPRRWRIFLVSHFDVGWAPGVTTAERAARKVDSIRLLTSRELRKLFPDAELHRERFLGLTKSFLVVAPGAPSEKRSDGGGERSTGS